MTTSPPPVPPSQCPSCGGDLRLTRLECPACGTQVAGTFAPGRLVSLPEPHASLLELFLRVRGNVKEMERELGLSYPTVRARLEEAFAAARPKLMPAPSTAAPLQAPGGAAGPAGPAGPRARQRSEVLDLLERGAISPEDAAIRLRQLQKGTAT